MINFLTNLFLPIIEEAAEWEDSELMDLSQGFLKRKRK